MTATEELRRLLDERGVKYETDDVSDSWFEKTTWHNENNLWWTYEVSAIEELPYGTLMLLNTGSSNSMRPEQAIAATLRRGTCKADKLSDGYLYFTGYWCRGCGERFAYRPIGGKDRGASPKFCPNCGRRIVDPTTNDVDAEVDA